MKADYTSFAHGRTIALYGLAIQVVLGLGLLLYAVYGRDYAALTASAYVLIGVAVWLTLAVVYDQHRRERVEAMEAEAFAASDAAASSVFEESARELRVAAGRLRWMQRFLVPGVSLVVGGLLVGVGFWLLGKGRTLNVLPDPLSGWGIATGLSVALVGFLMARYVSGLAKIKVWANLRAGAAYSIGSAFFGLALAVGHFAEIAGSVAVREALLVAFPIAMIALGAEVFLHFVLGVYQPRKPGEFPRPAFDSRVLGFVAAPDKIAESINEAINYQFGFDVASSWFYQLLARWLVRLVVFAVVVAWALTSVVVLHPHQRGLLLRFGDDVGTLEPGLHFKLPWPIDRVEVPTYTKLGEDGRPRVVSRTATGVRVLDLASRPDAADGPILWTNEHAKQEVFQVVQPARPPAGIADEGAAVRGRDLALVSVEVPLQYVIKDVEAYERLAPEGMRDDLLRAVGQRELMLYLATKSVTDVLSGERRRMSEELRERIVAAFTALNPKANGEPVVEVLFVGIEGAHPPQGAKGGNVADLFEKVVEAGQFYHAKLHDAEARRVKRLAKVAGGVEEAKAIVAELETLSRMRADGTTRTALAEQELKIQRMIEEAGGDAAATLARAAADRWERHMGERARLERYRGQLATYLASPAIFKATHYLDALRTVMQGARIVIADPVENLVIRTDLQDVRTGADAFEVDSPDDE